MRSPTAMQRATGATRSTTRSSASTGNQYATARPTVTSTYDAFGDLLAQATLLSSVTGTSSTTTSYYDQDGRRSASIDALGYLTTYNYDAEGNLLEQTEYAQA